MNTNNDYTKNVDTAAGVDLNNVLDSAAPSDTVTTNDTADVDTNTAGESEKNVADDAETPTPAPVPAPATGPDPGPDSAPEPTPVVPQIDVSINKGGIVRRAVDVYDVSSGEIIDYLQNQLGFAVKCDFAMWQGFDGMGYIRMRVLLPAKEVMADRVCTNYVDRFLQQNAVAYQVKEDVINVLRPYMYDPSIVDVVNNPEQCKFLSQRGIHGDRLSELLRFSKLTFSPDSNTFYVYLKSEAIIKDMLTSVALNDINGIMNITRVTETTNHNFTWEVSISRNASPINDVPIDAIFANSHNTIHY